MLLFQIRLALTSFRKTPLIMALVATMIAVSIGVLMTCFTIYHFMSSVPLEKKSDTLFAVQLDTLKDWPHNTHLKMVSYKDVTALLRSDIPVRHSASFFSRLLLGSVDSSVRPYYVKGRVTTSGLFSMFDAPFLYGGGWDKQADENFARYAVLNKATNDKLFGGTNSVGKQVLVNGKQFEVIGVLDEWSLLPRLYDLKNVSFEPTEEIFIPFSQTVPMKLTTSGNTQVAGLVESDDPFTAMLNSESIWIPYWVEFKNTADVERYKTFLANYVSEQQELGRFEPGNDSRLRTIKGWIKLHKLVNETNTLLVGLSALFVLVCVVNIMGLLSAKSFGRMKEFSIYRALGANRQTVVQMQMVEVLVLGLISGVAAIVTSWVGLQLVKAKFANYDQLAQLNVGLLALAVVISIVVCVMAYIYPVWKVSQVNPVAYIKE